MNQPFNYELYIIRIGIGRVLNESRHSISVTDQPVKNIFKA